MSCYDPLRKQVDEHQHNRAAYKADCELVRMDRIADACGVPTIIVHYNPDATKINGLTERVPRPIRESTLLAVLQAHFAAGSSDFLKLSYVCFDQKEPRMHGESLEYVTTERYVTEVDYEIYVGIAYPHGCAPPPPGTPWHAPASAAPRP